MGRSAEDGAQPLLASVGAGTRRSLAQLKHTVVKLIINPLLGKQILVVAALDDAALLQHHDRVGVAHRAQAVRNDKDGAPLCTPCFSLYRGVGGGTLAPLRGGLTPSSALHPWGGRSAPPTPGDFLPDEKVTKESPRGDTPLGTPLRGTLRSPCSTLCCYPLEGLSATKKDRFATLSLWANRSLFFPLVPSREHSLLSIRGTAGLTSRMLEGFIYRNQYR